MSSESNVSVEIEGDPWRELHQNICTHFQIPKLFKLNLTNLTLDTQNDIRSNF